MTHIVPQDLATLVARRAEESPDRLAYRYLGDTNGPSELTYGQLRDDAAVIAAHIRDGRPRGERALMIFPPGLEFIQAFFGCASAGAIAVPAPPPNPLKPKRSLERMASIVRSARPTVGLTLTPILEGMRSALSEVDGFAGIEWICVDALGPVAPHPFEAAAPDEVAVIQYTSGSTSDPKGAALSHGNVMSNLRYFDADWGHTPESVLVSWLPAFHDLGLIYGILSPMEVGYLGVQMSPIDVIQKPLRWLKAISDLRATHSVGPNFIYDLCVRKVSAADAARLDLSSWRMALTAAEPVRAETMARFNAHFQAAGFSPLTFCPGYGLSEGTCKVAAVHVDEPALVVHLDGEKLEQHILRPTVPGPTARAVVGCGRPGLETRVEIVDPLTHARCAPDRVGEIWVTGTGVAQSYWEQPEVTRRELRATIAGGDATPFLRTGDLGFMYQGHLFICGRIKDMVIIRGANHYPQDIEFTVQDAHPSVRAGCVAAFAYDDAGEEKLAVVAEVERREGKKLTDIHERRAVQAQPALPAAPVAFDADEIIGAITRAIAEQHGLQIGRTVLIKAGTIPKTTSGKIQRRTCKAKLGAGRLAVIAEHQSPSPRADRPGGPREELKAKVMAIVSEVGAIPIDRLKTDESLHNFGVDSLTGVNIAYEIGVLTGRDVPSELLTERDTIDKLVDYAISMGGAA